MKGSTDYFKALEVFSKWLLGYRTPTEIGYSLRKRGSHALSSCGRVSVRRSHAFSLPFFRGWDAGGVLLAVLAATPVLGIL